MSEPKSPFAPPEASLEASEEEQPQGQLWPLLVAYPLSWLARQLSRSQSLQAIPPSQTEALEAAEAIAAHQELVAVGSLTGDLVGPLLIMTIGLRRSVWIALGVQAIGLILQLLGHSPAPILINAGREIIYIALMVSVSDRLLKKLGDRRDAIFSGLPMVMGLFVGLFEPALSALNAPAYTPLIIVSLAAIVAWKVSDRPTGPTGPTDEGAPPSLAPSTWVAALFGLSLLLGLMEATASRIGDKLLLSLEPGSWGPLLRITWLGLIPGAIQLLLIMVWLWRDRSWSQGTLRKKIGIALVCLGLGLLLGRTGTPAGSPAGAPAVMVWILTMFSAAMAIAAGAPMVLALFRRSSAPLAFGLWLVASKALNLLSPTLMQPSIELALGALGLLAGVGCWIWQRKQPWPKL